MTKLIDLHQSAILSAMARLPLGQVLELANVPAGASVKVRDNRWLEIDDGQTGDITLSVGEDDADSCDLGMYRWERGPVIEW